MAKLCGRHGAVWIGAVLLVAGCKASSSTTAFFVSLQSKPDGATTLIQLGSERCILWSAAASRPTYQPEGYRRCSGAHPVEGGQQVAWRCESATGSDFTQIELDSQTYELAQGRLFVLSAAAGELQVLQLDRDLSALTLGELSAALQADPEVQAFLKPLEQPTAD